MPNTPVIILAAGASNRMFPLSSSGHKSFISVAGQSLLQRTITQLIEKDFTNLYVVVSSADQAHQVITGIQEYLRTHFNNFEIHIVVQDEPTGMGDAVLATKHQYPDVAKNEQFAVVGPYGLEVGNSLELLADAVRTEQQELPHAILVTHTDEPWHYGIIDIHSHDSERNHFSVSGIIEKPNQGEEPSNYKIQLAYLLQNSFWSILESTDSEQYSFETALNVAIDSESVLAVESTSALPSLKYAWNLLDITESVLQNQAGTDIHPNAQVAKTAILDDSSGPIVIERQAVVGDFAKIVGPAYVGAFSFVGDYSFVRHSCIEAEATVGANTEVVRSHIFPGATIHASYLADSILGKNSKIGAGLITANKRLDREIIHTKVNDKMVATQIKQLGVIIGEEAQVGIGVRTMPGILIAAKSQVMPGTVLSKNPENTNE
jgi:UDP-N-acetylglucosamine diphosphorylase / glucose-1-phosphate thymidylyltransferase / UDP-N-acetylgalactosamine diphosphorylase / glucosamine-1-phosphate N-acetyltransferase / galactosamine-1-phosphate N-acetyltransferase